MPEGVKGFEEGNKGRPKGSPNKATAEIRAKMNALLDKLIDDAATSEFIAGLKKSEHIELMMFLAKHTVPVPKEDNSDGTTDQTIIITGNLLK